MFCWLSFKYRCVFELQVGKLISPKHKKPFLCPLCQKRSGAVDSHSADRPDLLLSPSAASTSPLFCYRVITVVSPRRLSVHPDCAGCTLDINISIEWWHKLIFPLHSLGEGRISVWHMCSRAINPHQSDLDLRGLLTLDPQGEKAWISVGVFM